MPTTKKQSVLLAVTGVVCLAIIFVVNAFTMKIDSYFAFAVVTIIGIVLGVPIGVFIKRK